MGHLNFIQARYDQALHYLKRACEVANVNGMRTTFTTTILHRLMVEFRVSGWAVANTTLDEIEALPRPGYPQADAQLYAYQARRAQFRGLREEAADLGERMQATMLKTGSQYQELLFALVGAELLLDAARLEKARPMLARCRELIDLAPVFDSYRAALVFVEARLAQVEAMPALALIRLKESLALAKERNRKFYLRYLGMRHASPVRSCSGGRRRCRARAAGHSHVLPQASRRCARSVALAGSHMHAGAV